MSRKIISLACLSLALAAAAPLPVHDEAEEPPDHFSYTADRSDRMTVPIRIGGDGPFEFLVDTGSERTVISRELATRLALSPGRSATVHSMSGAGRVDTVVIPRLDLSRKSVKDIHAPALDAYDLGSDGLLGVDGLQSQRVIFDFRNKVISLQAANRAAERTDENEIVVTARSRFGRLILADARIEGEKVWVVVDTGSQVSIGNDALRRRLEKKGRIRLPMNEIHLTSVTGGKIRGDYTVVRGLEIGGLNLVDMPIAFADVHPFNKLGLEKRPAMILGMDALKAFDRVSMDFLNRTVRFTLPEAKGPAAAKYAALAN